MTGTGGLRWGREITRGPKFKGPGTFRLLQWRKGLVVYCPTNSRYDLALPHKTGLAQCLQTARDPDCLCFVMTGRGGKTLTTLVPGALCAGVAGTDNARAPGRGTAQVFGRLGKVGWTLCIRPLDVTPGGERNP